MTTPSDVTTVTLAGRKFNLVRRAFPEKLTPEWFVVDLLRSSDAAGVDRDDLVAKLVVALKHGKFTPERLMRAAHQKA